MNNRKIIATVFIILALVLGAIFFSQTEFFSGLKDYFKAEDYNQIDFPTGLKAYFKAEYYTQFGPFAISVELLIAGIYLFNKHPKTNFTLALFGFTALLDLFFNAIGLFTSSVPTYAMFLFVSCALLALWLAFSNTFKLGRISFIGAFVSFILGNAIEFFFNYL